MLSPELLSAFEGHETFDDDPTEDPWGTWVSAYAPIYNENGQQEV